jgi:hypothetical protein
MSRILFIIILVSFTAGCVKHNGSAKRIPVARAGDVVLYLDQIPPMIQVDASKADSASFIQNYIMRWAKKELVYQRANENLSPELKNEIEKQVEETRSDLVTYQYQRQMMLERMDTTVSDAEMENYYSTNQTSFNLSSNIVKALFIKLPVETPSISKIRSLARSNEQADLQQLETICYQFAEKFDDFNEEWVPLDRILIELNEDIDNQENFLKRTSFFESNDSTDIYMLTIRDYRLRGTLAPFEYVKEDIKRIIWNNRRFEFIQSLENGIYNDALKENNLKIFNF